MNECAVSNAWVGAARGGRGGAAGQRVPRGDTARGRGTSGRCGAARPHHPKAGAGAGEQGFYGGGGIPPPPPQFLLSTVVGV